MKRTIETKFTELHGIYIDPKADKNTKNQVYQDRRIKPMDLRCKTRMCISGTCRNEFYVREYGGGKKLYCDEHKHMALKVAQIKYRKSIPDTIKARNKAFLAKNPNYNREYYLRKKAEKGL